MTNSNEATSYSWVPCGGVKGDPERQPGHLGVVTMRDKDWQVVGEELGEYTKEEAIAHFADILIAVSTHTHCGGCWEILTAGV